MGRKGAGQGKGPKSLNRRVVTIGRHKHRSPPPEKYTRIRNDIPVKHRAQVFVHRNAINQCNQASEFFRATNEEIRWLKLHGPFSARSLPWLQPFELSSDQGRGVFSRPPSPPSFTFGSSAPRWLWRFRRSPPRRRRLSVRPARPLRPPPSRKPACPPPRD